MRLNGDRLSPACQNSEGSKVIAKHIPPLALLALGAAQFACQSAPPPGSQGGQDVTFVQEMMRESAELAEGPERSEPAVQAVEGYRGGEDG